MSQFGGGGSSPPTPWYKENPFWGAIGGIFTLGLAGLGFGLNGHPTLGRLLLWVVSPWGAMALWISANGTVRKRSARIAAKVTGFIALAVLLWWGDSYIRRSAIPQEPKTQPTRNSEHTSSQLHSPTVSPTVPRIPKVKNNDVVFVFKNSPLFTPARKKAIEEGIMAARYYLILIGFDVPKDVPPIGISKRPCGGAAFGFTGPANYEASISFCEQ